MTTCGTLVRCSPRGSFSLLLLLLLLGLPSLSLQGGGLSHCHSQSGTHVSNHAPPQIWPQSYNKPLCTSLVIVGNMRNMPQQLDKPLGIGRSLNTSLKPSWLTLARAKRFLDQEERPRGGEFVEKEDLSSSSPSSSSLNPRRGKRSKGKFWPTIQCKVLSLSDSGANPVNAMAR
ncbi:hypothetical protein Taro_031322 [Colocasia esculenta]|uniref:Uncharacterized protein n=1 Tax=Colocasia esculenta TaxID=4460 RepID=A0A843W625_COLES|nr:hypothetical protein [Colocasia esculenta]